MTLLAPLISSLLSIAVCFAAIFLGYWMGRNSIERPMRSENNPPKGHQGSVEDPGEDPYEYAMSTDDAPKRYPTIRE